MLSTPGWRAMHRRSKIKPSRQAVDSEVPRDPTAGDIQLPGAGGFLGALPQAPAGVAPPLADRSGLSGKGDPLLPGSTVPITEIQGVRNAKKSMKEIPNPPATPPACSQRCELTIGGGTWRTIYRRIGYLGQAGLRLRPVPHTAYRPLSGEHHACDRAERKGAYSQGSQSTGGSVV